MLVLSRKLNEQIVLQWGEQTAVVRVVDIRPGKVRLGITAPRKVIVHREEIAKRLQEWQYSNAKKAGPSNGELHYERGERNS